MASRLGIIAGQGPHPLSLARAAARTGSAPFIICLEGQADENFSDFETVQLPVGQTARIIASLKQAGCDQLVLAGKLRRPALADLKPDAGALSLLGKMAIKGDDNALRVISGWLAAEGFEILSPDTILARPVWPAGLIAGTAPSDQQSQDMQLGLSALAALDRLDVGQSVVCGQGRVLAIEAAEGTQAMIARAAGFAADGAVMVKMAKPSQDRQLDPPVIGLQTIISLAEAGISLMAIEADMVRAADPKSVIEGVASDRGVSLLAISWSDWQPPDSKK